MQEHVRAPPMPSTILNSFQKQNAMIPTLSTTHPKRIPKWSQHNPNGIPTRVQHDMIPQWLQTYPKAIPTRFKNKSNNVKSKRVPALSYNDPQIVQTQFHYDTKTIHVPLPRNNTELWGVRRPPSPTTHTQEKNYTPLCIYVGGGVLPRHTVGRAG